MFDGLFHEIDANLILLITYRFIFGSGIFGLTLTFCEIDSNAALVFLAMVFTKFMGLLMIIFWILMFVVIYLMYFAD